jgi:hypothetical protein
MHACMHACILYSSRRREAGPGLATWYFRSGTYGLFDGCVSVRLLVLENFFRVVLDSIGAGQH